VTTVPGTTYTDATVVPNSRYTYTVRARDAAGNVSLDSTPLTVTRTTVTEDATVLKSTPTSKNGATATLGADSSPVENFLTKFAVTGTAGKRIDKAVLRLYGSDPSNSGGAFRATTNTSWTESTVTWATAPVADGVSLGSVAGVTVGKWVDVDLAPLVKGDGTYSIRASSTSTDGVEYSSRNASTNRPEVVLTVTTP
jgi:chitodextrinase